jgi:hypothetical protein
MLTDRSTTQASGERGDGARCGRRASRQEAQRQVRFVRCRLQFRVARSFFAPNLVYSLRNMNRASRFFMQAQKGATGGGARAEAGDDGETGQGRSDCRLSLSLSFSVSVVSQYVVIDDVCFLFSSMLCA